MKLSTWNVNGLRSSIGRGFEDWLVKTRNDVVCLQEVKAREDLLSSSWFKGYNAHWHAAKRPGYSGVVTLVSSGLKPLSIDRGIGDDNIDVEGRVISVEFEKYVVVNVYAPHSHRELTRLEFKMRFCEQFNLYLEKKKGLGKPLIITGDLNVAHQETDLANPAGNRNNAGFLPQERQWIDALLRNGLVDAFRFFCTDSGHYTWWSMRKGVREQNIGWRLDYILVDKRMRAKLNACFHSPEQKGSDHCPVTVQFS